MKPQAHERELQWFRRQREARARRPFQPPPKVKKRRSRQWRNNRSKHIFPSRKAAREAARRDDAEEEQEKQRWAAIRAKRLALLALANLDFGVVYDVDYDSN